MAASANWILENLEGPQGCQDREERPRGLPTIGQPTQVGYYSKDAYSNLKFDFSELKYLHLPARMDGVRFDLNIGYENAVGRTQTTNPNMDSILRWTLSNKSHLARTSPDRPRFICRRGTLAKVMCTPYDTYDGWIIRATRYGGNIYLCRLPNQKEMRENFAPTEMENLMRRWGFKFEQYMTSDTPASGPEHPSVPVNENREFCCLVRTSVGHTPLLLSGEIDAVRPEFQLRSAQATGSTEHYVELKTSKLPQHPGQVTTLRKKMVKWWAQSFLLGAPSVFCGFRDDTGVVGKVVEFKTQEMPAIATGFWSETVCLQFLRDFLDLVSRYVVKDDPRVVYKFEWSPGQQVTFEEMAQPDRVTYRFLPDWYIQGL